MVASNRIPRPLLQGVGRYRTATRFSLAVLIVVGFAVVLPGPGSSEGACLPISLGALPTAGAISVAADSDCYTFTGAVGNDIRIRIIKTSGSLDPLADLSRSNGTISCGPTYADEFTCALDTAGTHTLRVRDYYGGGTGGYNVYVQRLDKPLKCASLSFGAAPKAATIGTAAEADCYTFTGLVGDDVRVRVIKTSGSVDPFADVMRPDGTSRCGPTYADEFTCTLDTGGPHTLLVRDYYGGGVGAYNVYIQRLDKPQSCTGLGFGAAPKTGSIKAAAEADCYTFTGAAGEDIRIRVIKTSGSLDPLADLIRPNGTTRCGATYANEFTCMLDASGTHAILVRDYYGGGTGGYNLYVQRLDKPEKCGPLTFGALPTVASIGAAAEADCYTFTGNVGDDIRIRIVKTSGSLDPFVDLMRPDGTTRCGLTYADEFTCTLDASGQHSLLLRDYYGAGTGGYSLYIERLDNPLRCIVSIFGALPTVASIGIPGQVDCYTFPGNPGDDVRVRVVKTSGSLDPFVDLMRPDGTTRCGLTYADEFTCTLDASGQHSLLLRDYYGAGTGGYSLYIERLDNPVGCTALSRGASPTSASLDVAAEVDCYTFTGLAGHSVRVRVITTSGTVDPLVDLMRPDGTTRCGPTYADEFICSLDVAGDHTLLVRDYYGAGTGGYSVRVE